MFTDRQSRCLTKGHTKGHIKWYSKQNTTKVYGHTIGLNEGYAEEQTKGHTEYDSYWHTKMSTKGNTEKKTIGASTGTAKAVQYEEGKS